MADPTPNNSDQLKAKEKSGFFWLNAAFVGLFVLMLVVGWLARGSVPAP